MENVIICVKKRGSYFIKNIVEIVARQQHMTPERLKAKTRKREIVEARQLAMYLATEYTTASLATIGEEIGEKNHSTVLHSCKIVNNLQETDRNYRGIFYILKEKVEEETKDFEYLEYEPEIPTEIWLQIYNEPLKGKLKVTWSVDQINDTDIRYILDKRHLKQEDK
ncbi:Chromosomal replication initiator protein DnaA [subsurface metagenome]